MTTLALQRLKEICITIEEEALVAIAVYEAYRPTASNPEILNRFNNTYEAWTFNTIRQSLHRDLVMILCRLWDERDDVASIPTAIRRMNSDNMVRQLLAQHGQTAAERRRNSHIMPGKNLDMAVFRKYINGTIPEKRQRTEAWTRRQITTLRRMVTRVQNQQELKSLKRLRHKVLAHAAIQKNGLTTNMPIRLAKWGDEEKVLHVTLPIVNKLCLIVGQTGWDYSIIRRGYRNFSKRYWAKTISIPNSGR